MKVGMHKSKGPPMAVVTEVVRFIRMILHQEKKCISLEKTAFYIVALH